MRIHHWHSWSHIVSAGRQRERLNKGWYHYWYRVCARGKINGLHVCFARRLSIPVYWGTMAVKTNPLHWRKKPCHPFGKFVCCCLPSVRLPFSLNRCKSWRTLYTRAFVPLTPCLAFAIPHISILRVQLLQHRWTFTKLCYLWENSPLWMQHTTTGFENFFHNPLVR